MARGIWTGAISFGLINIPVSLMSAKQDERLHFRMLDKRDNSPIGYKQFNKATGREVQRKNIVKGYEYEPNQFVIVTDKDFKQANPKQSRTIDIEDFIDLDQLDPLLFDRPYYLVPGKNGEKGYVLLKRVLEKKRRVAIARFVLRDKQHLVALMARGDYVILEILRFAKEIQEVDEAKFLEDVDLKKVRISEREVKMAEELVNGMTTDWKPENYKDTYSDELLKHIKAKIKSGDVEEGADVEELDEEATDTNVVDLMPLLAQSLKRTGKSAASAKHRKSAAKRSTSKGAHA